jgi:hypothetical protein
MMTAANILLGNDDSRKYLTWQWQPQIPYLAMMTAANILLGADDSRKYLTWR